MKKLHLVLFAFFLLACGEQETAIQDKLNLKEKLNGAWTAKAFDGELHESWHLNDDGWMEQRGFYIEAADTSYSAKSQIMKVGEEVILFSVIKNSNPKIFKAIETLDNKLVFFNDDYSNPFKVTYEFQDSLKYRRTIQGKENDSLVEYIFTFRKVN